MTGGLIRGQDPERVDTLRVVSITISSSRFLWLVVVDVPLTRSSCGLFRGELDILSADVDAGDDRA